MFLIQSLRAESIVQKHHSLRGLKECLRFVTSAEGPGVRKAWPFLGGLLSSLAKSLGAPASRDPLFFIRIPEITNTHLPRCDEETHTHLSLARPRPVVFHELFDVKHVLL